MTRLSLFALAFLVASAVSLVSAQYRARQLFIDLETSRAKERKLDVEWRVLQLEQTSYSKHTLVESAAVRDLHMVAARGKRMRYLPLPTRIAQLPPSPALAADAALVTTGTSQDRR